MVVVVVILVVLVVVLVVVVVKDTILCTLSTELDAVRQKVCFFSGTSMKRVHLAQSILALVVRPN